MTLSPDSRNELRWWLDHVDQAYNDIGSSDIGIVVTSDASLIGWGCECEGESSGRQWLSVEKVFHINYVELKAVLFALKCFQNKLKNKHVRLLIDNTTAVSCIQNMGKNHSVSCNEVTLAIWSWCIENNIWISAAHIPDRENVVADHEPKHINMDA